MTQRLFAESGNSPPRLLKRCSKCRKKFPATNKFFPPDYKVKDGCGSWCHPCRRAYQNSRYCAHPRHRKRICFSCGVRLTKRTASRSVVIRGHGSCRKCSRTHHRRHQRSIGVKPLNYQTAGTKYTFSCGCTGILPPRGKSNKFAAFSPGMRVFQCRVSRILVCSQQHGGKYVPIPRGTPHLVIRKMMEDPNCVLCGKPLKWFGVEETPHLHHDHDTGQIYGFTHARCNRIYDHSKLKITRRRAA
jgi:hypothetical protein